jgi:hypothetical protein
MSNNARPSLASRVFTSPAAFNTTKVSRSSSTGNRSKLVPAYFRSDSQIPRNLAEPSENGSDRSWTNRDRLRAVKNIFLALVLKCIPGK